MKEQLKRYKSISKMTFRSLFKRIISKRVDLNEGFKGSRGPRKNHGIFDLPSASISVNMFTECAVALGCSHIISGDKHLKSVKNYMGIKILNPKEFLIQFQTIMSQHWHELGLEKAGAPSPPVSSSGYDMVPK